MRVIAGSKRRILLETIPGDATRPTTDRIKETLFNMLNDSVVDANFLDLFAGSGQIGIEALSRGAAFACFVEQNKQALSCIRRNLEKTGLTSVSRVMQMDVCAAIDALQGQTFSIIFMDPPYHLGLEESVLDSLQKTQLLSPDGLLIVEADCQRDFSFVDTYNFSIVKEKYYKTNKHVFLQRI